MTPMLRAPRCSIPAIRPALRSRFALGWHCPNLSCVCRRGTERRRAGENPPPGDYRFEVARVDPAMHNFVLNELDRRARGTARPADHAEFALNAGGNVFFLNGECVGYAYGWPDGRIGPLACASEAYLVQIFAYALVTLSRTYGASWCTTLVPGSDRRVARAALRAGLRVKETFTFASSVSWSGSQAYVGYHELLL